MHACVMVLGKIVKQREVNCNQGCYSYKIAIAFVTSLLASPITCDGVHNDRGPLGPGRLFFLV